MKRKQLGKLRQWAGEVITAREKTIVTEGFEELEQDVELRRGGIERLFLASKGYHHSLTKKKDNLALDEPEKLLPLDTLGVVMINHGEEFPEESEFGSSLIKLGRAHCRIAILQETYAITFRDNFVTSIEKFGDEIKEYDQMKKKLESRRLIASNPLDFSLSYDAAISKVDKSKNSKKEKERKEAEEELDKARARYEETEEDIRAHMHSIQENEIDQTRELTAFLDLELNFVEQYLEVLKGVRSEWSISSATQSANSLRKPSTISRSTSVKSISTKTSTATPKRSRSSGPPNTTSLESTDEDEDEGHAPRTPASRSRRSSMHATSDPIRTPTSRPSSRASRKRADSSAGPGESADKHSRKMSMAGWASSAMGSFSGRSKKSRDKEQFSNLEDGSEDTSRGRPSLDDVDWNLSSISSSLGNKSLSSLRGGRKSGSSSPQIPPRILKPPSMQDRKVMRALYDFDGAADELSFKVGDEITVTSEVLDGWWLGELNGKQGLFPTPYTEVVPAKPPLPARPDRGNGSSHPGGSAHSISDDDDNYRANELDEGNIIGANTLSPYNSPFYGGPASPMAAHHASNDAESILSSLVSEGEDENDHLVKSRQATTAPRSLLAAFVTPSMPQRSSSDVSSASNSSSGAGGVKKGPPPPPPPRRMTPAPVATPPVPARRPSAPQSKSFGMSSRPGFSSSHSSISSLVYDTSPFESATELESPLGRKEGCGNFKQNPFKPKGMCSNCLEFH
ncbi:hypothetical protein D9757_004716 [Collybiopsis confluens]|uniref:BAR-domain-containing protein n=1 Tax=Collybiopsis confluens TaxID=2823264 RepID=A0A8H5HSL6_9AGAR|nr:hypothetical protein D9757_004716 [Collybiopsis confluens]